MSSVSVQTPINNQSFFQNDIHLPCDPVLECFLPILELYTDIRSITESKTMGKGSCFAIRGRVHLWRHSQWRYHPLSSRVKLASVSETWRLSEDAWKYVNTTETGSPEPPDRSGCTMVNLPNDRILVHGGSSAALAITICFSRFLLRNHRERITKTIGDTTIMTDDRITIGDTGTLSGTTNTGATGTQTGTTTLVPNDTGLSIPAYLECQFGFDVRVTKQIAKGGFSAVSLGEALKISLKTFGNTVIIKKLTNVDGENSERVLTLFYQEISIMSYLGQHPNIATLLGYCQKPYCIIMKFYPYGSLNTWIYDPDSPISKSLAISFGLDIAKGLQYMHSRGICHADVKPSNVLIDEVHGRPSLVLTDFGIAQVFTAKSLLVAAFLPITINALSLKYAAPEAIAKYRLKYPFPADQVPMLDVYSYGITYYEILCRASPYS